MIDLYRAFDASERRNLERAQVFLLIQQILAKMDGRDNTLRLNCLRLLKLIAEDHALLFVDVSFIVYAKIQVTINLFGIPKI